MWATLVEMSSPDLPLHEFKQRVLQLVEHRGSDKIDERDIEHLKQHDYFASCFLAQNYDRNNHDKSLDRAVEQFVQALLWRKSYGARDLVKNSCRELFQVPFGTLFDHGDRIVYYLFSKRVPIEYKLTEYSYLWTNELLAFEICQGRKVIAM